jgi:hypothetical protein
MYLCCALGKIRLYQTQSHHPKFGSRAPLVQHNNLLGATAAALAAGSFYNLDLVVSLGLDGAGTSALGTTFCLNLESCRIAFLILSVSVLDEIYDIAYLEDSNDLTKFFGIEVVFGPLLKWKKGWLVGNDVVSP